MKLGRESFVLVVAPVVFLGATYVLLFCAERPLDAAAPRFDLRLPAHHMARANDAGLLSGQADLGPEADRTTVSRRSSKRPHRSSIRTQPFRRGEVSDGASPNGPGGAGDRDRVRDPARRSPIKGRVLGPDEKPVKGAHVRVTESPNLTAGPDKRLIGGSAETYMVALSETGFFEFERAHGMVYQITVDAPDLAPTVIEAVGAGQFLEVMLQEPGVVAGRVLDATDQSGLDGAEVTLSAYGISQRTTLTSSSGGYVFQQVPPGPVVIEAAHPQYVTKRRRAGVLAAGGLLDLQLHLEPGLVQRCEVMAGEGGPRIPGVKVEVEDLVSRITVFTGTTDGEGAFEATNLRGDRDYVVRICDSSGTYGAAAWTFNTGLDGVPATLRVSLQPGRVANVAVVDALSSLGMPGAEVYMSASMNGFVVLRETAIAGLDGKVQFRGVDFRSQLTIQAYLPGYAITTLGPEPLASELPAGQFTLVMHGAISLEGLVTDTEDEPVAGVLVRISPASATKPSLSDFFTWSDEEGHFAFPGLPPGELMVVTLVGGYDTIEVPILLVAGETPELLHLIVQALSQNE